MITLMWLMTLIWLIIHDDPDVVDLEPIIILRKLIF